MSYATPIVLKLTTGRKTFQPGPFSLGKWSAPVNVIAVAWTCFITVLFVFPSGRNPTAETMSECLVDRRVDCVILTRVHRLQYRRAPGSVRVRWALVDLLGTQVV